MMGAKGAGNPVGFMGSLSEMDSPLLGPHCEVSCRKGPTRHAYAWQIGPLWQYTLDWWLYGGNFIN